jgi:hypothetical protein
MNQIDAASNTFINQGVVGAVAVILAIVVVILFRLREKDNAKHAERELESQRVLITLQNTTITVLNELKERIKP